MLNLQCSSEVLDFSLNLHLHWLSFPPSLFPVYRSYPIFSPIGPLHLTPLSFLACPPSPHISPLTLCFLLYFFQSTPFPSHVPSPSPVNSSLLTNPSFSSSLPCFSFPSPISTSFLPELQFMVEHHLYRQQQGAGDECSSESCLSDRPSPDSVPTGEELPHDDEATAEAFEKLRCQMEGMFGDC